MEEKELKGRYGKEPRVEALTMFRNVLYRIIEEGVNDWIGEKRFLPKFLVASGVFLFGYLFFTFVVRDPLPILDEIAIAIAGSIGVFFLMGRRDKQSDPAMKKRIALRTKVDRIVFESSRFVRKMEEVLSESEEESREELLLALADTHRENLNLEEKEEAKQFIQALQKYLGGSESKKYVKLLSKFSHQNEEEKKRRLADLTEWLKKRKVDLSLYLLYLRAKEMVKDGENKRS